MIKTTIASILIITITLTTCGWFLFMPRKAQATFQSITGIQLMDIWETIKEIGGKILRAIGDLLKIKLKQWLVERILAWGRGEITGEEVFQEMPWKDWFKEAADEAAGEFLNDFFDTNLCKWTNPQIKIVLQAMATGEGAKPPECTLSQIRDTLEDVFDPEKDNSWEAFIIALQPQNNDLGIYITAQTGTLVEMAAAVQEKITEANIGRGYKAQTECAEWKCWGAKPHPGKCTEEEEGQGYITNCEIYKIVQPATAVAQTYEFIETIDLDWLTKSEDIKEILAAFISALTMRLQREISSGL